MKKVFTLALSLLAFNSFAQVAVPNGDMEDWHNYTVDGQQLEAPDGWFGSDSAIFAFNEQFPIFSPQQQIFQSGTSHGGSYAARIVTADIGLFGIIGGTLSNAQISFNQQGITYEGGAPVNQLIPYVNAWVRYDVSSGTDTASMTVLAIVTGSNGDSVVGTGTVLIEETNGSYMHVSAPVSYMDWSVVPEKIQITFNSSASSDAQDGSTLRVDDIQMATLSVRNAELANAVKVYPNPSNGVVSIYNTLKAPVTIKAFTSNGQLVAEKQFTGNNTLDLTAQASGVYFFTVADQNGNTVQHGKLNIIK